jgi:hypothetical protein
MTVVRYPGGSHPAAPTTLNLALAAPERYSEVIDWDFYILVGPLVTLQIDL